MAISWYVRDALGNVLSTYEERIDDDAECPDCNLTGDCLQFIWSEANIYGAERLGMQDQNIPVAYHYTSRLGGVNDAGSNNAAVTDTEDQDDFSYTYDEIGQHASRK